MPFAVQSIKSKPNTSVVFDCGANFLVPALLRA